MTTTELDCLFCLRWRLERADWAAFEALPRAQSPFVALFFFLPLFLIGALFELAKDELMARWPSSDWYGYAGVGGIFCSLILWCGGTSIVFAMLRRRRVAKRYLPNTETVLTANPEHCAIMQDGKTRYYAWETLHVIHTPSHVFLCPEPNDAIVVPLRAFETEADLSIFAGVADQLSGQAIDQIESRSLSTE